MKAGYPGASQENGCQGRLRRTKNAITSGSHRRASDTFAIHVEPGRAEFQSITGIDGIAITASGFMLKASSGWPCSKACNARVTPQPGQYKCVKA